MTDRPVLLCVDDEPTVLASLKEQFRRLFDGRFRVEVAQDAAEALEVIAELEHAQRDPAVIISDHIMPGMKGDELLIRVHARMPRTRKILLTGQAGLDAVANVVNHGALYRYIAKPWQRDDLELTIQEAVRSYQQEIEVERQRQEILEGHAAARRFVPFEFLRLLGRQRLGEVSLHDHVEQQLSIFFSDIRSYTTLVEGRTPKQNFDFINEYLGYMEPAILDEGGFIDSFMGDGIMALFEGSGDRVVRAGIASMRALDRFNAVRVARGDAAIRIGIGINSGPLMLGVIGGKERLNAGVIGDPVNTAARLETFSKQVGASMLVSEDTVARLDDPDAYALRPVDHVRFKGKSRPVRVFEVLDALPEAERARKLATRDDLAAARAAMAAGDLRAALAHLTSARELDAADPVITRAIARCRAFLDGGVPEGSDLLTHSE
jgi:class 3 adenylate cyclase